jgi:hypothetical protein
VSLGRIRRWLRRLRRPPLPDIRLRDTDPDLESARRRLAATTRLVTMRAAKSARSLRHLNRLLALRARAIENIEAAQDALAAIDKGSGDDK